MDGLSQGEAHEYCFATFLHGLGTTLSVVLVDNTNSQLWEYDVRFSWYRGVLWEHSSASTVGSALFVLPCRSIAKQHLVTATMLR